MGRFTSFFHSDPTSSRRPTRTNIDAQTASEASARKDTDALPTSDPPSAIVDELRGKRAEKATDQEETSSDRILWIEQPSHDISDLRTLEPRHFAGSSQSGQAYGQSHNDDFEYAVHYPPLDGEYPASPTGLPATESEAKHHIEIIRRRKRENGDSRNAKDLEAALELISNDLYHKPMHFILELLQNADDNSYLEGTTPKLKITYRNGSLRFDSNETGFRRIDVEAICSIGQSSKSTSQARKNQIGEKGVGFKSVFKVADSVSISSGHYSFMFSAKEPLGRLTPIWEKFPAKRVTGFTSIFLNLRPTLDLEQLVEELRWMDGRILMFLRNIKEVDVEVYSGYHQFNIALHREDESSAHSGLPARILTPDIFSPYIMFQYPVLNLPQEPRRRNQATSNIVLAFPSSAHAMFNLRQEPNMEPQKVYSFLPIREYGFKFVLQADFILVANREEIDSDSPWNKYLLDRIPHALLACVNKFNSGSFRFLWIRFLPLRHDREDFFQYLWLRTKELMSKEAILESINGAKMKPSDLTFVPEEFAEENGNPLIPPEFSIFVYVSQGYHRECRGALESLGVRYLSAEGFLDDLSAFIQRTPKKFQSMSPGWHSRLSQILDPLILKHGSSISSLRVAPLRHGEWVAPDAGPLLFPLESSDLTIPNHIRASVVHPDAANDASRRNLLRKFQAQNATRAEVCRIIIRTHAAKDFIASAVPLVDMISHAAFMYKAKWKRDSPKENIWVVRDHGLCQRSNQVYLDSIEPFSAGQVFKSNRVDFPFLHREYSTFFSQADETKWLHENLGVHLVPRLVALSTSTPGKFSLHYDFRLLIQKVPTLVVLQVLRAHWNYYRQWILIDKSQAAISECTSTLEGTSHGPIRAFLSSLVVRCFDGSFLRLDQTYLPRGAILQSLNITQTGWSYAETPLNSQQESIAPPILFPLVAVPDPEDEAWDFLQDLGVVIHVKAKDLLARLRQLQGTNVSGQQIDEIYERIQRSISDDDIVVVRRQFREDKLVWIPSKQQEKLAPGRWLSTEDCVWDGPACLERIPRLRHYYPKYEMLFCQKLGITDASLKTLVSEVKQIETTDSLAHIRELFKHLNHRAYGTSYWQQNDAGFFELQLCQIFPVWTGKSGSAFDCLKTAGSLSESNSWYIADLQYLRDAFDGRTSLLAFDTSDIEDIDLLVKHMGCDGRKLSNLAKREMSIDGWENPNGAYTRSLRGKWKYLARLIPITNTNRVTIMKQLLNVHVYQPEGVSVTWTFQTSWGTTISGFPEKGRVMLIGEANILKVYLIAEDMEIGCPPLELTEELSSFCGIENTEHVRLLSHILVQRDMKRIEQDLNRREIPGVISDETEIDPVSHPVFQPDTVPVFSSPNTPSPRESHESMDKTGSKVETISGRTISDKAVAAEELNDRLVDRSPTGAPEKMKLAKLEIAAVQSEKVQQSRAPGVGAVDMLLSRAPTDYTSNANPSDSYNSSPILPKGMMRWSTDDFSPTGFTANTSDGTYWRGALYAANTKMPPIKRKLGNHGLISLSMPVPSITGSSQTDEDRFTAELYVSGFLKNILGDGYNPPSHWTSELRSRAGHKPYATTSRSTSTFTIDNAGGKLKQFLLHQGYQKARYLTEHPTFHIQVAFSGGPVHSSFDIDSEQIRKAENLTISENLNSEHKAMFIVLLVYNLYTEAALALFPDPWHAYRKGLMSLESYSEYQACFGSNAPTFYAHHALHDPAFVNRRSKFKYQELKRGEIRLLRLEPGSGDMPLKGSILHIPITSSRPFFAISYVWGTAPNHLASSYFGTPDGNMLLSHSLASVLLQIREKGTSSLLWADAICINQLDMREKGIQVRLMNQIYQRANKVIAWIGHEYDGSHEAIKFLSKVGSLNGPQVPRSVPSTGDKAWVNINSLVSRAWFTRIWITQELVLGSKVIMLCGRSEIEWDHFFEALTFLEREVNSEADQEDFKFLLNAGPAYALGLTRQKLRDVSQKFGLLELLELFAHSEATLERDKLFALLGLAHDSQHNDFNPDYDSSMEEILRRYAKRLVIQGQVMQMLYRAGVSKSYQFCSWIPCFTQGSFQKSISEWDANGGTFQAALQTPPTARFGLDGTMEVKGYSIDVINSIDKIRIESGNVLSFFEAMTDFKRLLSYVANYRTGESPEDLLFKLPIGNARRAHLESAIDKLHSYRVPLHPEAMLWPANVRQLVLSFSHDQDPSGYLKMPLESQKIIAKYWQTAAAFSNRMSNSSFCFTKERYVGLVPHITAIGDKICLLHGSRVPFVMRKAGSQYKLIGECYIHGIMFGEGLRDSLQESTFYLI